MIKWFPVGDLNNPTPQVDYYKVYENGDLLAEPSEESENGMPDSIGGIAPDAVRDAVANNTDKSLYEATYHTDYSRQK